TVRALRRSRRSLRSPPPPRRIRCWRRRRSKQLHLRAIVGNIAPAIEALGQQVGGEVPRPGATRLGWDGLVLLDVGTEKCVGGGIGVAAALEGAELGLVAATDLGPQLVATAFGEDGRGGHGGVAGLAVVERLQVGVARA